MVWPDPTSSPETIQKHPRQSSSKRKRRWLESAGDAWVEILGCGSHHLLLILHHGWEQTRKEEQRGWYGFWGRRVWKDGFRGHIQKPCGQFRH